MSRILTFLVILSLVVVTACSSDDTTGDTTQPDETTAAETEGAGSTATTGGPETTTAETTTAATSSGSAVDPCTLLTADDITAVTGVTFGEGTISEMMTNGSQMVCDWISTGDEFATAQVLIIPDDVFDVNQSGAEEIFGLATEPVTVPGVDQVYATAEGSIVAMQIGGAFVQVAYIPSGPGNVLDATLQLATLAAGRMP